MKSFLVYLFDKSCWKLLFLSFCFIQSSCILIRSNKVKPNLIKLNALNVFEVEII